MDVVALRTTLLQEECLVEFERVLLVSVDKQVTTDHAENAIVDRWLDIYHGGKAVELQFR